MTLSEKVSEWLMGNQDAAELVLSFHKIAECWDDLIDLDAKLTSDGINEAFYLALVTVPRNTFYRKHFDQINPLVEAAIFDWHTANKFESEKDQLETAFGLRCTSQLITVMCARIIGGREWAQKVNDEIRALGETYSDYIEGFR